MPTYLHPGVYVEEIPSGARPIESAGTSTAAIIGFAAKGPIGKPTLIFSWKQYQQIFGGIQSYHGETIDVDYMGHTVQAFFSNGGGKAYIVRLAPGSSASTADLAIPGTGASFQFIDVEAASAGDWANGKQIRLTLADSSQTLPRYNLEVGANNSDGEFEALESFLDVTLVAGDADHAANIVNANSNYIRLKDEAPGSGSFNPADGNHLMVGKLVGGDISGLDISTEFATAKNLKLKVSGTVVTPNIVIQHHVQNMNSLVQIAAHIQKHVRDAGAALSTPNPALDNFECYVENGSLALVAGALGSTAEVKPENVTNNARADLRLHGNMSGSSNFTGQRSLDETRKTVVQTTLESGSNGSVPVSKADYDPVFAEFKDNRNINIVLIPDHAYDKADPASKSILDAAKAHCEATKNRMVILDPPKGLKLISEGDFKPLGMPSSTYTATYYPWVEVANPHYHPEKRAHLSPTYLVPPSGFAAGMWAKTDGRRGVWKAPAGLQTGLTGAVRTEFVVGDDAQDQLNPIGVNCYRTILTEPVIWGTRTLATRADPEWRYVPIRRTAMMIEESIYRGIQWAVFEPNDHNLWGSLRLNIETFMDGLHRSGAFQGEKASDAYFVQCGLGSTMTQGDIDAGRVIVEVGFAPLKPAEFVIVRIQQKTAQL